MANRGGGTVLGTAPPNTKDAALNSLFVNVSGKLNDQRVTVTDRNVVVATMPMYRVLGRECTRMEITSSEAGTFATFPGMTDPTDPQKEFRTGFVDPNLRPNFVGIFTDLTGPAPQGLSVSATVDTRFTTKPTAVKLARDAARHRGHRHRTRRPVASRPARRPPHATRSSRRGGAPSRRPTSWWSADS